MSSSLAGPAGVRNGRYHYTDDLLQLEAASWGTKDIPAPDNPQIAGFLPIDAWAPFLQCHPDQRYAAFLRRGITQGFRIGCPPQGRLKAAPPNLKSALDNPLIVSRLVQAEVEAGRLAVADAPEQCHKNPIGVIPKPHQPGKFRMIVDLSAPREGSVNDLISTQLCSLTYASIEQAARLVKAAGRGALMGKLDLSSAYRRVPVHPQDYHLLAMEWQGVVYQDRALPFGLRSAPKLFTAVADGLAWALCCKGITSFLHYLDDFFFCASSTSEACREALEVAVPLCGELGLPIVLEKLVWPSTVVTFLGIEIDSVAQELRLPQAKLARIQATIRYWEGRRTASKRDLQSLIGLLNHAAAVVRPGRTFLRQLIDTMKTPKRQFQQVRLNQRCRADIAWWALFLRSWNGIALFPNLSPGAVVVSDASRSWGCGAIARNSHDWFQLRWPSSWKPINIATKELFPVVVAAAIWGKHWSQSCVEFQSDNQAVVAALSNRSARDPQLMHLLRCLFFLEAHFGFEHRAHHRPGKENLIADALSRGRITEFRSLFPQAAKEPSPVPPALEELLLDLSLNWTSPRWRALFDATLLAV